MCYWVIELYRKALVLFFHRFLSMQIPYYSHFRKILGASYTTIKWLKYCMMEFRIIQLLRRIYCHSNIENKFVTSTETILYAPEKDTTSQYLLIVVQYSFRILMRQNFHRRMPEITAVPKSIISMNKTGFRNE